MLRLIVAAPLPQRGPRIGDERCKNLPQEGAQRNENVGRSGDRATRQEPLLGQWRTKSREMAIEAPVPARTHLMHRAMTVAALIYLHALGR